MDQLKERKEMLKSLATSAVKVEVPKQVAKMRCLGNEARILLEESIRSRE
jgi:hypothetical protein